MNTDPIQTILSKLDNELATVKIESLDIVTQAEKSIGLCKMAFTELKKLVIQDGFQSEGDEIDFFKNVKPQIFSKLIYYVEILRIETHRPRANKKLQKKYLRNEFIRLRNYLKENYEFCQYYKSNQTCLDDTYFKRSNDVLYISSRNYNYLLDSEFSTSHDELVAHIIACEMLGKYIDNEIGKLNRRYKLLSKPSGKAFQSLAKWTDPKIALIELIYALDSAMSINHGKIEIKELIRIFEQVFNIELGKSYRAFIDIQRRKKDKTKYLDHLKQSLLNRLDDQDRHIV